MQAVVVIIDDDPIVADLLKMKLQDLDIKIITALDGEAGLNAIRHDKPAVIITDYQMPKMDGLTLIQKLKDERIFAPTIWISGNSDDEVFKAAWKAGVYEVMEKPLDMKKFRETVEAAIVYGTGFVKLRSPQTEPTHGKRVDVTVALEKSTYEQISEFSKSRGTSVSEVVKALVEKNFQKKAA